MHRLCQNESPQSLRINWMFQAPALCEVSQQPTVPLSGTLKEVCAPSPCQEALGRRRRGGRTCALFGIVAVESTWPGVADHFYVPCRLSSEDHDATDRPDHERQQRRSACSRVAKAGAASHASRATARECPGVAVTAHGASAARAPSASPRPVGRVGVKWDLVPVSPSCQWLSKVPAKKCVLLPRLSGVSSPSGKVTRCPLK